MKRHMFRTATQTALNTSVTRPTVFNAFPCKFVGQYRARRWDPQLKNKESEHKCDDMNLSLHQASHVNIENAQTKKIDPIKYDGSYTPKMDPETKKPILGADGKTIPDPNKGGQYVAVLLNKRQLGKDVEPLSKIDPGLQDYLDTHEQKISTIINNGQKKKNPTFTKKIGSKDDE